MEKWETESLKWLHKVPAENAERTTEKPLNEVIATSKKSALEISAALGLKTVEKLEKTYSKP